MTTAPPIHRTLRVAFLGWARLSAQAAEGTGYNFAASELAAGLASCGHDVLALTSGMRFRPVPGMRIRHLENWRGIRCFDLINSAIPAPAAVNFGNNTPEMDHPEQVSVVLRWLDEHKIDLVHVHSLEGQPMSLLGAIRASGRAVVVTMHNYWFLCPQVDLLHQSTTPCLDYEGGRRCESCMPIENISARKLRRSGAQAAQAVVGHAVTDAARSAAVRAYAAVRRTLPKLDEFTQLRNSAPPDNLWQGFEQSGTAEPGGRVPFRLPPDPLAGPIPQSPPGDADANGKMLRADHHLTVLNEFGSRRGAGIGALNSADRIVFPSEFNRDLHVRLGLDPERALIHRYGLPHFDIIHRRAARQHGYRSTPWTPDAPGPLRLAFFGTVRPNKGLHVLCEAVESLDAPTRERIHVLVRASGHDTPFRRRLASFTEVAFGGGYDTMQLVSLASGYDVGLLPHIWFDNSPLVMWEHLHAGKFTLASSLGGACDTINDHNGRLLAPSDPGALAEAITRLVSGEVPIPAPEDVHRSSTLTSYRDAVEQTCELYAELVL